MHGLNIMYCQYSIAFQWHSQVVLPVCIFHRLIKNRSFAEVVREGREGSCGSGDTFRGSRNQVCASNCCTYFYNISNLKQLLFMNTLVQAFISPIQSICMCQKQQSEAASIVLLPNLVCLSQLTNHKKDRKHFFCLKGLRFWILKSLLKILEQLKKIN